MSEQAEQTEQTSDEILWGDGTTQPVSKVGTINFDDTKLENNNKPLLPPTNNVLVVIKDAKPYYNTKAGEPMKYKTIALNLQLVNGIEVGEETKYKNMYMSTFDNTFLNKIFCGFDAGSVDMKKDYYSKPVNGILRNLKSLALATETSVGMIAEDGMSEDKAAEFCDQIKGKKIMVNIGQVELTSKNPDSGSYEGTGEYVNEIKGFKKAPEDSLV